MTKTRNEESYEIPLNPLLTPEQKEAVTVPAGNILVSAAAGSGKTFVMTERLAHRVMTGELSMDQCLVLTFTNEAAKSMEKKIREKFDAYTAEVSDRTVRKRLEEQNILLQRSHISTIHAFCLWLIQNFPQDVKDREGRPLLEAEFSTLDPIAAEDLRKRALAEVMDVWYKAEGDDDERHQAFGTLLEHYSSVKSDEDLRKLLLNVHSLFRSRPDYAETLETFAADLEETLSDFFNSEYAEAIAEELELRLPPESAVKDLKRKLYEPGSDSEYKINFAQNKDSNKKNRTMFQNWLDRYNSAVAFIEAVHKKERVEEAWDNMVGWELNFRKPSGNPGDPDKEDFVEEFILYFSDFMIFFGVGMSGRKNDAEFPLFPVAMEDAKTVKAGIKRTLPVLDCFFQLLRDLDARYAELKRQRAAVDFADYEHFALSILQNEDSEGASYCRRQFKEVYIDEYQDTSSIQEEILRRICRDRLFMVGDVKQSIYRFRYARPDNFLKKLSLFRQEGNSEGQALLLKRNFRSSPGILDAINQIFVRAMTKEVHGIDYQDGHAMAADPDSGRQGREVGILLQVEGSLPEQKPASEISKSSEKSETPEEQASARDREEDGEKGVQSYFSEDELREFSQAAEGKSRTGYTASDWLDDSNGDLRMYTAIAHEILHLKNSNPSYDWSDFCILSRGNQACDDAAAVLDSFGIPHNLKKAFDIRGDYQSDLQLSLLQCLDNVRRDIPLASLLLSGFLPETFTEEELLDLRIKQKSSGLAGDLYSALSLKRKDKDELGQKASRVLSCLERWRRREPYLKVLNLIYEIWNECDYFTKLWEEGGQKAVRNAEDFAEELRKLEEQGRIGLHSVVDYYETRIEDKEALKADNDTEGQGVQIMTFHKSKGLEFKVVFLSRLFAGFKLRESSDPILIGDDGSVGFDIITNDSAEEEGKASDKDGQKSISSEMRYTFPSICKFVTKRENRRKFLTEETCLLYVAMSRAAEKVYLCCKKKGKDEDKRLKRFITRASENQSLPFGKALSLAVKSYQDIFLAAALHLPYQDIRELYKALMGEDSLPRRHELLGHIQIAKARSQLQNAPDAIEAEIQSLLGKSKNAAEADIPEDEKIWDLKIVDDQCYAEFLKDIFLRDKDEILEPERDGRAEPEAETAEEAAEDNISEGAFEPAEKRSAKKEAGVQAYKLNFIEGSLKEFYDFRGSYKALPKRSVSEIKRESQMSDNQEAPAEDINLELMDLSDVRLDPRAGLPADVLGTALHKVLRFLNLRDFSKHEDSEQNQALIRAQLRLLAEKNFLSEEEQAGVSAYVPELERFTASSLADEIRLAEETGKVFRELPFTFRYKEEDRESLVQGVIDIWYQSDDELVLADFKSDRLPEEKSKAEALLRERYSLQLKLYTLALEAGLKRKVDRILIWSIRQGRAYAFSRESLGLD